MIRPALLAAAPLLALALSAKAHAATTPELFQKMKTEYSLARYSRALETLQALETQSEKPDNERYRQQVAPALAFYRGAILASLGRIAEAKAAFRRYLDIQPDASVDPSLYAGAVVKAFEGAKRERSASGAKDIPAAAGSLSRAYERFRVTEAPETGEAWSDGPVQYIMTREEAEAFSRLSTPQSRAEFIETFWQARHSRPESRENPARNEFERRVAFADRSFRDGERRGSMTDRGMVFILLGPPTYVGRKPLGTEDASQPSDKGNGLLTSRLNEEFPGAKPYNPGTLAGEQNWREIWHYRKELLPAGIPYQQVDFEFLTKKGYGENVLQREPSTSAAMDAARRKAQARS
ncbi:MAG: GWxTD domain-containing protein [Acidobacteriota bacterium]|nr:GWxTD domain-containing protein [Acidobacteriota bacterium]